MSAPSLPSRIQDLLAGLYGVEAPRVDGFVRVTDEGDREVLLVRERRGAVEISLCLPAESIDPKGALSLDVLCQVAEGVSHFLYIAERSRRELPATRLELEIQAEVDKFLLLAGVLTDKPAEPQRMRAIFTRLFHQVEFLHAEGTETGERYRLANKLAARFLRSIARDLVKHGTSRAVHRALRRFFDAGLREKFELAAAA